MRTYRSNKFANKTIATSFIIVLLALGIIGYSYSHWKDTVYIEGTITPICPDPARVRIMKTLNGSFTDPYTGNDISTPTNLIHVGTDQQPGWPTKFQLVITVENRGTVSITDEVYDVIENTVEPISWAASKGTVTWVNKPTGENFLTWTIGTLNSNEKATLEIWIQTLPNPTGNYEPTSEDQYIKINRGANVTASSEIGNLFAQTEGITLTIIDDGIPNNNLAVITPTLPYSTPWAEDTITYP